MTEPLPIGDPVKVALLVVNAADTMMRLIEVLQDADPSIRRRYDRLDIVYRELWSHRAGRNELGF